MFRFLGESRKVIERLLTPNWKFDVLAYIFGPSQEINDPIQWTVHFCHDFFKIWRVHIARAEMEWKWSGFLQVSYFHPFRGLWVRF